MRNTAKKGKSILDIDGRGRITLPKEMREGIYAFTAETLKDGAIKLVPQQIVSTEDAKLIQTLKGSIADFKTGRIKKTPRKWLDSEDEKV